MGGLWVPLLILQSPTLAVALQSHVDFRGPVMGNNSFTGEDNLCIDNHLVPEFLLIGAKKAGTSSYANMFVLANGVVRPEVNESMGESYYYGKELHIFDDLNGRFQLGKEFWLSHYPKCDLSKRQVAIDFSPSYLRDVNTPQRILDYYGSKASRLKFAVMLRSPLHQIHSSFYHTLRQEARRATSIKQCNFTYLNSGFHHYMQDLMQSEGRDPCFLCYGANYKLKFKAYFSLFAPSQFTVIPFRLFTEGNQGTSIITKQWQKLGLAGVPPRVVITVNTNDHNTVEHDLDAKTLKDLQAFLSSQQYDAKDVARGLVSHDVLNSNPELAGFDGDPRDVDSVASWLRANW